MLCEGQKNSYIVAGVKFGCAKTTLRFQHSYSREISQPNHCKKTACIVKILSVKKREVGVRAPYLQVGKGSGSQSTLLAYAILAAVPSLAVSHPT